MIGYHGATFFPLAAVAMACAACATIGTAQRVGTIRDDERLVDYRLHVECACDWIAGLPDGVVEGSGRTTLELPDEAFVCASVTKAADDGRLLRARVEPDGDWADTDVGHDAITVCARTTHAPLPQPVSGS